MPHSLRYRKKDAFLELYQGDMPVVAYRANFHVLSRYDTQLFTTCDERILFFVMVFNYDL